MSTPAVAKQEAKWAAESDADTLMRAAEIKRDKKRLSAALAVLKEKAKAHKEAVADVVEAQEEDE